MKPVRTMLAMAALLSVCVIGSALAGDRDERGSSGGDTVWIESVKTLNLDAAGLEAVAVKTHNGPISCDAPLQNVKKSRRKLTGTIGDGGGSLAIKTHNGKVRIMGAAG